jgi:hypothetical protein
MQHARIDGYKRDPATKDVVLHAIMTDETGKPIEGEVEVRLSQDAMDKLFKEQTPTEEVRIQELLNRIHKDRLDRILNVEKIDDRIEELTKSVEDDFKNCTDKLEVMKMQNAYRVRMALLTQKRHLSRFSIQEESDLSLQLAKIRAKANEE